MGNNYEILSHLTDPMLPSSQRRKALKSFADENNWLPSDEIDEYLGTGVFSNGHLVIEHGLNNTAVISFLKRDQPFGSLTEEQKLRLLSISYNNLVEWHFFPDLNGLTRVFNRVKSLKDATRYISINEEKNVWSAEAFERITERRPNPNIKSLDDALMETISFWKRALASELGSKVKNENISALFNSILFARALEDDIRRKSPNFGQLLVEKWASNGKYFKNMRSCIIRCIKKMGTGNIPTGLFEEDKLNVFDRLDRETVLSIFKDFYVNKFARYYYDFSLMSKHALSRIYEHYVSLLSRKESPQMKLFPDLPQEISDRTFGGIYTPQYIARFFARYLKENLTPITFRCLKTADPACGSGIFLRTLLEMQCDPFQGINMRGPTKKAFSNILGIDIDENACQATRLSLYLLHLVLTDSFPRPLKIVNSEATKYFDSNRNLAGSYDAVIANPPFIKWENIKDKDRDNIKAFMADYSKGKVDMYQAFLKLGMELLKDGGHLLYVLPHSFLISENAKRLRTEILSGYWIRFVVDLSEIDVFEGIGAYVILLIIQKKLRDDINKPKSVIVRCREFPGQALQTALEGKRISTDFYEIYEMEQSMFLDDQWEIMAPKQAILKTKLKKFPVLGEFLTIRVGFNTGANDIFIREVSEIDKEERATYIPYLHDREMQKYTIPKRTQKLVFYPYLKGKKIRQSELKSAFPKTWTYLKKHSKDLRKRSAVIKGNCEWWSPERSRLPENMLIPKIISPHLILLPKFSLDSEGVYGISRSPLMYLRSNESDINLLYYFLAILNSSVSFWQIANLSHKYSRGYFMLEPKTLKKVHVPDPSSIPTATIKEIQEIVEKRLNAREIKTENKIDNIVADLYGLSEEEKKEVGMGD